MILEVPEVLQVKYLLGDMLPEVGDMLLYTCTPMVSCMLLYPTGAAYSTGEVLTTCTMRMTQQVTSSTLRPSDGS